MPDGTIDNSIVGTIGKGTVLHWKNYEFETGEKKDSFFVVLSNHQYGSFLAIRPTTQTEYYERSPRMTREFVLIEKNTEVALPKKCVLDFAHIRSLNWVQMRDAWGGELTQMACSSSDLIDRIDKLMQGSKLVQRGWIGWITASPRMMI